MSDPDYRGGDSPWWVVVVIVSLFAVGWYWFTEPGRRADRIRVIEDGTGCHVEDRPRPGCTQIDVAAPRQNIRELMWFCCDKDMGK